MYGDIPGRLKILMIEDNRALREVMCEMFQIMGNEVEPAGDGVEGLRIAKEFRPDILFCDIGLPGMTGHEVARSIRSEPLLKEVFMVALTGYVDSKEIQLSLDSGFDRHLSKPVTMDTLKQLFFEVRTMRGLAAGVFP